MCGVCSGAQEVMSPGRKGVANCYGIQRKVRWSPRGIKSDFVELLLGQRRNRMQPTEAESHSRLKEENEPRAAETGSRREHRWRTPALHGRDATSLLIHGERSAEGDESLGHSNFVQKVKLLKPGSHHRFSPPPTAQMPLRLMQLKNCSQGSSRKEYSWHRTPQLHNLTGSSVTKVSQKPSD